MRKVVLLCFSLMVILSACAGSKVSDGWNGDLYYKNGNVVKNDWAYWDEDGSWYFMGNDGLYVKNQWVEKNNQWYYMGDDGKMLKDQWIAGKYYVNNEGVMLKNIANSDGSMFDSNGVFIPAPVKKEVPKNTSNSNVDTRKIYEQKKNEGYQCKIDPDGNCWVVSVTSDFMPRLYDITIYDKFGEVIKYGCDGFHKEGSMTYIYDNCKKNEQQISQSDYERVMDNFDSLQDCY